jgi:WD repeat-containing protein 61
VQSPDGQRVALGTRAGVVHIFDAGSGTLAATLPAHALPVRSLAWAPDSHVRRRFGIPCLSIDWQ